MYLSVWNVYAEKQQPFWNEGEFKFHFQHEPSKKAVLVNMQVWLGRLSDSAKDSRMLCESRVSCLNVVCHRQCSESNERKLKVPSY